MSNEKELLEKKDLREEVISRTEVLDKVGELLLLPNTEYANTEQIADYYEVDKEAIQKIIQRHRDELESDGYRKFKKSEIINAYERNRQPIQGVVYIEKSQTKTTITFINYQKLQISNAGMNLFPIRAILHMAFYLSESEVARQVRKELLNENPKLYYEFSKANQTRFKKYETEIKNYLEFSFGKDNVKYQVSCGKYMLDFILFDKIHIEVDENGHASYDKEYEKERRVYILENTNYYTIRYNPQKQKPYGLIQEILRLFNRIGYPKELLKIA